MTVLDAVPPEGMKIIESSSVLLPCSLRTEILQDSFNYFMILCSVKGEKFTCFPLFLWRALIFFLSTCGQSGDPLGRQSFIHIAFLSNNDYNHLSQAQIVWRENQVKVNVKIVFFFVTFPLIWGCTYEIWCNFFFSEKERYPVCIIQHQWCFFSDDPFICSPISVF